MNKRIRRARSAQRLLLSGLVLAASLTAACTAVGQEREALIARGKALVAEKDCRRCHTIGATGTPIAPDLARTGKRYSEADLARWIADPAAQRPTIHMPSLGVTESEARALAAYITSLE